MLECRMPRCIWVLLDEDLYDNIKACIEPIAKKMLFQLEDQLNEEEYVKVIVALRAVWKVRRDMIHEDKYQAPFATCNFITHYIAKLRELEDPSTSIHRQERVQRSSAWTPPPVGSMKGNVDGAICSIRGKSSAAVIFRDDAGIYQGEFCTGKGRGL